MGLIEAILKTLNKIKMANRASGTISISTS